MKRASWNNTTLVKDDMVGRIRRMKAEPGEGRAILGSGNLVSQLAQTGLINERIHRNPARPQCGSDDLSRGFNAAWLEGDAVTHLQEREGLSLLRARVTTGSLQPALIRVMARVSCGANGWRRYLGQHALEAWCGPRRRLVDVLHRNAVHLVRRNRITRHPFASRPGAMTFQPSQGELDLILDRPLRGVRRIGAASTCLGHIFHFAHS